MAIVAPMKSHVREQVQTPNTQAGLGDGTHKHVIDRCVHGVQQFNDLGKVSRLRLRRYQLEENGTRDLIRHETRIAHVCYHTPSSFAVTRQCMSMEHFMKTGLGRLQAEPRCMLEEHLSKVVLICCHKRFDQCACVCMGQTRPTTLTIEKVMLHHVAVATRHARLHDAVEELFAHAVRHQRQASKFSHRPLKVFGVSTFPDVVGNRRIHLRRVRAAQHLWLI
mmetsp:Transcript_12838/g.25197  ORF Transcript_12838/g.25197 Transcript_12838/m.25197 type:complete len:222 (+) Transcript_12838:1471-2136(+)